MASLRAAAAAAGSKSIRHTPFLPHQHLHGFSPVTASRRGSLRSPTASPQHSQRPAHATRRPVRTAAAYSDGGSSTSASEDDEEEGTMRPLDPADASGETFGPLAVLLVGFMAEEVQQFKDMLEVLEAGMVKVVPCTQQMLAGSLGAALEADAPAYEQPPLGMRRSVILSGMYNAEIISVITQYYEAGLPPAVFASAVRNNYHRIVGELAVEIHREHAAMVEMQQRQQ